MKQDIPYGYCHCGCGQKTAIQRYAHTAHGYRKGEPRRYLVGHSGARSLADKLAEKTGPPDENGCLPWLGTVGSSPYGTMTHRGKARCAHRWAFIERHGDILPDDIQLHHTCQNTLCVNPDHLEMVDPGAHGERHKLDHCKNGHPFDEANTYWYTPTHRMCRKCRALAQRRLREKRRKG